MPKIINYGLAGANAPLPHQIAVKELLCFIDRVLKRKHPLYDVVSEMNVRVCTGDKEYFEKNSDIVIWKKSKTQIDEITEPITIIEITRDSFPIELNNDNKDTRKIISYFDNFPSLKECLLYNYPDKNLKTNTIKFIRTKNNEIIRQKGKPYLSKGKINLRPYLK
ncbi:MAG: hypothetical protein EPN82_13270 [Bacteroidetes bacterium]|nr:MAG: hypothetical protein EPN82_13270 [Bacteroidota bacterium]